MFLIIRIFSLIFMDHFSIGHGEDVVDIDKVDVDEQAPLLAALELDNQAKNEERTNAAACSSRETS